MSFWTDLESGITNMIKAMGAELEAIATKLEPLVEATAEQVAQIALTSVAQQATATLTGQEKLNAAVSNVVSTLASQGKAVLASTAETAVQTAYTMASNAIQPAKS